MDRLRRDVTQARQTSLLVILGINVNWLHSSCTKVTIHINKFEALKSEIFLGRISKMHCILSTV